MEATGDNAVEGTPASDSMPIDKTTVTDSIPVQGTPQTDVVTVPETPPSDSIPIEGTPQNDTVPKPGEAEIQLEAPHGSNPEQQRETAEKTPDTNDEELFVTQGPPQKRIRRSPHLTNAEIRESVKIGLDDSGVGRIPKASLPVASLRPNVNTSNKGKGRKKSKANDVDVSTLGGSDIIADVQTNFGQPPIPTSAQGNKQSNLNELVESLPPEARSAATPDKKLIIDATKKFTKAPRVDKKGGWKHANLKTSLFHHQVLGAGFMREREKSKDQPKGGMLCDVMGLGKTIQTLANIVDGADEKLEDNVNTTLIVAPRGLITQWKMQIEKHVQNNVLVPILCHYAGSRNNSSDIELFLQSKIILTSYDEIRISYPKMKEKPENLSPEELLRWGVRNFMNSAGPLHQFRFRRIILDEGQQIRNPESQTSIAVRALHGHYKWILTGTPLLNHSAEFWAYFKFLGVPNIGRFSSFVTNFCNGSDLSNQRLVNIVQKVVYRRTYRSRLFSCPIITLPNLNEETILVNPFVIEQALYKMLVTSFIDQLNRLANQQDEQSRCFLTMLLKLRMLNSHILCVQDRLKGILSDGKNMAKLQIAVADCSDDEANINRDIYVLLEELVKATKQAKESQKSQERMTSVESMLENFLATADNPHNDSMDWMADAGHDMPSSKVLKTRDTIRKWFKDGSATKCVIFTQFRDMTKIFANMCTKEKWAFTRLTGDMTIDDRDRSLKDFQALPEIKILIASLKAGGVGLDITAANKCILVEPWWNDAIQQQAFCRLFRIGQERDVEIVKLVAKNTIDDYMMKLQEMKLKEIEGAIGDARLPSVGIQAQLIHHFGDAERLPDGTFMIREWGHK
ncbi:hypothetical protein EYB26_001819 [Talaromyces marneffei]|uniref:uncharacterized protein n=1 Tax=Talaromyces marneffei TaxID=37727 RepID=UPI0012AA5263|nr:uncharacterized protein EYB26_001819 [Talaromyces marneffei]QGA14166.1 hypothetical protein EYB26_001819 [Talaromyces marneffei]